MRALTLENSEQFFTASASAPLSTKNAWALYARRRWPANTIKHCMAEWDLTDGQARGLVFAQASQSTIDAILDHPRGGFGLGLLILEIRMQQSLRGWVKSEQGRLLREAERNAGEAAALAQMAADLPAALAVGGLGGACLPAEPRSFGRRRRRPVGVG